MLIPHEHLVIPRGPHVLRHDLVDGAHLREVDAGLARRKVVGVHLGCRVWTHGVVLLLRCALVPVGGIGLLVAVRTRSHHEVRGGVRVTLLRTRPLRQVIHPLLLRVELPKATFRNRRALRRRGRRERRGRRNASSRHNRRGLAHCRRRLLFIIHVTFDRNT